MGLPYSEPEQTPMQSTLGAKYIGCKVHWVQSNYIKYRLKVIHRVQSAPVYSNTPGCKVQCI